VPVAIYTLAAWTLFVWGTRVRNALGDDERALVFVVPVVLGIIAIMAIVRPRRWGRLLALATSLAWLVRAPAILVGDYDAPFKVVHLGLAAVTWALAAWALTTETRRPAPA